MTTRQVLLAETFPTSRGSYRVCWGLGRGDTSSLILRLLET